MGPVFWIVAFVVAFNGAVCVAGALSPRPPPDDDCDDPGHTSPPLETGTSTTDAATPPATAVRRPRAAEVIQANRSRWR
jgi:hypothetical protein